MNREDICIKCKEARHCCNDGADCADFDLTLLNKQDDKIKELEILVDEYYNAVKAHEDGKLKFCKKFNCCTLHQVESKIKELEKELEVYKKAFTKCWKDLFDINNNKDEWTNSMLLYLNQSQKELEKENER